jgi:4,5:9,10-diseco-3-hydroxy-5,9,17-trioxoandrosta-1(10),2-diene-4-oate hydrolase
VVKPAVTSGWLLWPFLSGVLALGFLALGSLVADPLGAVRWAGRVSLRESGAREEVFRGPSGETLHTWVAGPLSGDPPVVLLHGLGASSDYWSGVVRALARSGRTVVIPDSPGSGQSDAPGVAGWGVSGRIAALRSLTEALGLTTFDLVGHSLGGWTAARYAIEEPRRVRRLVLVDPGGFSFPPGNDEAAFRRQLVPRNREEGRRLLGLLFFRAPFPAAGFVVDALARNYAAPPVASTVASITREDGLVGRERELPDGTVLIWGARETLFPLEDGRRTAALLPNGRLLVVTGVGHDGPLEAPGPFTEALLASLEGRPLKTPR